MNSLIRPIWSEPLQSLRHRYPGRVDAALTLLREIDDIPDGSDWLSTQTAEVLSGDMTPHEWQAEARRLLGLLETLCQAVEINGQTITGPADGRVTLTLDESMDLDAITAACLAAPGNHDLECWLITTEGYDVRIAAGIRIQRPDKFLMDSLSAGGVRRIDISSNDAQEQILALCQA